MDSSKKIIKYPVGIQTFTELREGGYVYVDKTFAIHQLVKSGKYYFLSRPRRFGKSLLLSTLQTFFEGRKELFEGLAIEKLEKEWISRPVLHLSLASYNKDDSNSLQNILDNYLRSWEKEYGVDYIAPDFSMRFRNVIKAAYSVENLKVAVLIDEYDAPLVANLDNEDRHSQMRNTLKSVYSNLKDMDPMIEFAMLTGITKFSKMSIFSGLNNLKDISLLPRYSEICGITENEIDTYFHEGVMNLAVSKGTDYSGAMALLKENYDGYHFSENSKDIYNPFSLLNALSESIIKPFWFMTAKPSFLVERLKREKELLSQLLNEKVGESAISDIDTYTTSPLSLLFQTGYLTIKDYDTRRSRYTLGIPNKEVETGLFQEMLSANMQIDKYKVENSIWDVRDALEDGDPNKAFEAVKTTFAGIPPMLTRSMPEIYYENNLYMLFRLVGIDTRVEWWSSNGRIDMVMIMPKYIYIVELKLEGSPTRALEQIKQKDYALQFRNDCREIFLVGVNFSKKTRNIDGWEIEKYHCE